LPQHATSQLLPQHATKKCCFPPQANRWCLLYNCYVSFRVQKHEQTVAEPRIKQTVAEPRNKQPVSDTRNKQTVAETP